jgi:hypothetical protein
VRYISLLVILTRPPVSLRRPLLFSGYRGFVGYDSCVSYPSAAGRNSDTCDAASGRCCVQTTPAAAAFGATLAGWPPPRLSEQTQVGRTPQVPRPQYELEPIPTNRRNGAGAVCLARPHTVGPDRESRTTGHLRPVFPGGNGRKDIQGYDFIAALISSFSFITTSMVPKIVLRI